MKLKDMVSTMKFPCTVVIRDTDMRDTCEMRSDSRAMKYFEQEEVNEWMVGVLSHEREPFLIVVLKDDSTADDREKVTT